MSLKSNWLRLRSLYQRRFVYRHVRLEVHPAAKFTPINLAFQHNCTIRIGANTMLEGELLFDRAGAEITLGERSFCSGRIVAATRVNIGDDVMISWGVTIVDHNSHALAFSHRAQDVLDWRAGKKDWQNVKVGPVEIGNKVWIGFNAIVLKGVTLGEGVIVGAGAVVTKSVPPWSIVAGNPAQIIRSIPPADR